MWNQPNFYHEQDRKSGSLLRAGTPRHHRAGEDVVLTNVLSFNAEVWDSRTNNFVDLGTPETGWSGEGNHMELPRVWDSWTLKYRDRLPPYAKPLEAIRITIRCFDPATKFIKQVTVVHRFND